MNDKLARFGCGALVGAVLAGGTLLGQGLYPLFDASFERHPALFWAAVFGLPGALGGLSLLGGWRVPQKLADWLLRL
jgi:predicted lysophospholipase L1 biosynthesis ABC-type transport system permease subunit